jgi:hypothetical protein
MIKTASLDQLVRTIDAHPFPFQGRIVAMTLTVVDGEGAQRQVDARFVNEGPAPTAEQHP